MDEDIIVVLHKSNPSTAPPQVPIETDDEDCNYLNGIALFILCGIFLLIWLISTSHCHFAVCSRHSFCTNKEIDCM